VVEKWPQLPDGIALQTAFAAGNQESSGWAAETEKEVNAMYWNIRQAHECEEICEGCMFQYKIRICGKNVICSKGLKPPIFPPCRHYKPKDFFYSHWDEKNNKRNKK
jgi:hypothetical protein